MARRGKIRAIERKDRKSRYGISFPRSGKTPRRVYFETKTERDRELKKAQRVADAQGSDVFNISAADVQLLRDLREILPPDVDPREAARLWVEVEGKSADCSFHDASREYMHSLQLRKLSLDHRDHVQRALDRLEIDVGGKTIISKLDDRQLSFFFSRLPFAPRTLANYQQYTRSFFAWCVKRGYCRRSPMDSLGKIKVPETEAEFMPISDVEKFFRVCSDIRPKAAPLLALSFFAGMRTSSILRLRRSEINFDQRGILLPGSSHKTGRRFYVEGFEPNLWEWLEPWRGMDQLPTIPKSTLITWRKKVYEEAEVKYPDNGGRHSFCTYHIALKGSANETATLLTHRGSVSTLYNHYRGNSTKADAERYFSVVPG